MLSQGYKFESLKFFLFFFHAECCRYGLDKYVIAFIQGTVALIFIENRRPTTSTVIINRVKGDQAEMD